MSKRPREEFEAPSVATAQGVGSEGVGGSNAAGSGGVVGNPAAGATATATTATAAPATTATTGMAEPAFDPTALGIAAGDGEGGAAGGSGSGGAKRAKKKKNKKKWKGQRKDLPWIYVTGMPPDVTVEELLAHFQKKCGIVKLDPVTKQPKVKIYTNPETGACKGDGSVCFLQPASVELAIDLLDGVDLRPGTPLSITRAEFKKKEGVQVSAETEAQKKAARIKFSEQKALLSWVEDDQEDESKRGLKVIVLRHMFKPEEAKEEGFVTELEEDVKGECELLGEVKKIEVFPHHPDGVVMVRFRRPGAATLCIEKMNGRFFDGRKLVCEYWDGVTKFDKKSTNPEDEEKRIDAFGDWLEAQSSSDEDEPVGGPMEDEDEDEL